MKTTNYKISIQLKEIGFKAEPSGAYFEREKTGEIMSGEVRTEHHIDGKVFKYVCCHYDLETILEALPEVVNGIRLQMHLARGLRIGYSELDCDEYYICYNLKDETLATTAARLLIKLVEEGIINLKE